MTQRKQLKSRHGWGFLTLFFVMLFTFLTLISSGKLDSEDGWLYASVARNIYYHGQIASAPDEYPAQNVHMNTVLGKDGIWRAPGSLGYSISLVPAVAISDLWHRLVRAAPPEHFPLQHDWSFHLFASLTNAFWGALAGLLILLLALELRFSLKKACVIAISTLITTNLIVLTKSSFAQMMYIACLLACLYFIKRYVFSLQWRFIVLAALSYLLLAISYNVSYYLPIIPLATYLLLQEKSSMRKKTIFLFGLGIVLLVLIFPHRFLNLLSAVKISPKILFEGLWGFLLSPGKSIFLYSPPLLLILIFWHKIKKNILPELIFLALLTLISLYFLGSASITDHNLPVPIWHGGMAWGPRYMGLLIPFGMLLVFHIIDSLSVLQRKLIVLPLFALGLWIQIVGTSIIYLRQYEDIPYNIFIGGRELTVYDYASFIPRYTPLLTLSKRFVANLILFPSTVNRGLYEVRFFDGFDIPYHPGNNTFRGFRQEGYISLVNPYDKPIDIQMIVYNAPDSLASSSSAQIQFSINDRELKSLRLPARTETDVSLHFSAPSHIQTVVRLKASYTKTLTVPHVIYVKSMTINGQEVNLASLDYPDVSTLGSAKKDMPYRYYGNKVSDNWMLWDLRANINALTLDYWWIKNLYYWDWPQVIVLGIAIGDLTICVLTGTILLKKLKEETATP